MFCRYNSNQHCILANMCIHYDISESNSLRSVSRSENLQGLIRNMIELYPFWAQIFLTVAMAVERYILICCGNGTTQLLSRRRRFLFYSIISILTIAMPVFYTLDFSINNTEVTCIFWAN